MIALWKHQLAALDRLKTTPGAILLGGVGSGKSLTALAYYEQTQNKGVPLIIITAAIKRDKLEWRKELSNAPDIDIRNVTIDSWQNIKKHQDKIGFFIFDEDHLTGNGVWVDAFYKINRRNYLNWIVLSATPGDTWLEYIPIFVAHGFYRNRTEFINRHVIANRYAPYFQVVRYLEESYLEALRRRITVPMVTERHTKRHIQRIICDYNLDDYRRVTKDRWNIYTNRPIKNASELCHTARKVVYSNDSFTIALIALMKKHNRLIVFYQNEYELAAIRSLKHKRTIAEHNGHRHDPLPETAKWIYAVQFESGKEAWNCTTTDAMVFMSESYSYKTMEQAMGRIDRMNTPYIDLYYYVLTSEATISQAIKNTIEKKTRFNAKNFEALL